MMDIEIVIDLSGLSKAKIIEIISNYAKYAKEFMPDTVTENQRSRHRRFRRRKESTS
jgi:hypothetical protein